MEDQKFLSRDMSWLAFNKRVLEHSNNENLPLAERMKFLKIYLSNLDEFFMVRIGALRHRQILKPDYVDEKTGCTTEQELKNLLDEIIRQSEDVSQAYNRQMFESSRCRMPEYCNWYDDYSGFHEYRHLIGKYIVREDAPIPFFDNLTPYVVTLMRRKKSKFSETVIGILDLSRIPYGDYIPFCEDEKIYYTTVWDIAADHIDDFFEDYKILACQIIQVTRNADMLIDSGEYRNDDSYKKTMQKLLEKRKKLSIVRLQVWEAEHFYIKDEEMSRLLKWLQKRLHVKQNATFLETIPLRIGIPKDVSPECVYKDQKPINISANLKKGEIMEYLRKEDILLNFPSHSISTFIDLLYEAAEDPATRSIMITIYRLSSTSRIAAALAYAADRGKDVHCIFELQARFDEERNIEYATMLESVGCHVSYGVPGYKVHSKMCLITRDGSDGMKYITQIGTGNYNETTSELYTDLSYITSNVVIGEETEKVFRRLLDDLSPKDLTTYSISTSPGSFKSKLLELMDREKMAGENGFIAIKVNSIDNVEIMKKLEECAKARVTIWLFVRGICCLYANNPFLEVKGIVDRYLEHSRIYVFGRSDPTVYIGSGDLLTRNLDRRVETFVRITNPKIVEQLVDIINILHSETGMVWKMTSEGDYVQTGTPMMRRPQDEIYHRFQEDRFMLKLPDSE